VTKLAQQKSLNGDDLKHSKQEQLTLITHFIILKFTGTNKNIKKNTVP
jgi:hypothetical protein